MSRLNGVSLHQKLHIPDVIRENVSVALPRGRKLVAHSTKALKADIATGPESTPLFVAPSLDFPELS
jgi:hypothetical protein